MGFIDDIGKLLEKLTVWIGLGTTHQEQIRLLAAIVGLLASIVTIVAGLYALSRWLSKPSPLPRAAQEAKRRARNLCQQGEVLLQRTQLEAAIATFTAAIDLHPRSIRALKGRGLARLTLGDAVAARTDFGAWIAITPHQAEPYFHRALASRALGDILAATQDCRQALLLSQNHGPAKELLEELTAPLSRSSRRRHQPGGGVSHAPCRVDERYPALLGHEQAIPLVLPGAGCTGRKPGDRAVEPTVLGSMAEK
ncbi:MAG: hypothetical protein ABL908_20980 [Hyphomicrobium sp.]